MPDEFPVVDASDWGVDEKEPGGSTGDNVWLADPDGARHLFKPVVQRHGRRQGEDWAEKATEQLARLIGVPTASVDMAERSGRSGVLSRDLRHDFTWQLQPGEVCIAEIDPRMSNARRERNRLGHNPSNIKALLGPIGASDPALRTAFDEFCGYLLLDAWVVNADRHQENWGLLVDPNGNTSLARSFDHGNCLAFNLTDDARARLLDSPDRLARWVRKGYADRFEDGRRTTLVALFRAACALASADTATVWLDRLAAVDLADCEDILRRVPKMSAPTRRLCVQLLTLNRRRLLDG